MELLTFSHDMYVSEVSGMMTQQKKCRGEGWDQITEETSESYVVNPYKKLSIISLTILKFFDRRIKYYTNLFSLPEEYFLLQCHGIFIFFFTSICYRNSC